jgi:catechol 2,3-dioxygenase-like lactoylglutathione lyase family enzyme
VLPAAARLVAFAATLDLEASHAFYGGTLGLQRVEATPFANVYDVGGQPLRVTRVGALAPAPYTVLGWEVPDLAAALAAVDVTPLRYDGLEQDDDGVWTTPSGTRVAWFRDPDGNVLSLHQHLA